MDLRGLFPERFTLYFLNFVTTRKIFLGVGLPKRASSFCRNSNSNSSDDTVILMNELSKRCGRVSTNKKRHTKEGEIKTWGDSSCTSVKRDKCAYLIFDSELGVPVFSQGRAVWKLPVNSTSIVYALSKSMCFILFIQLSVSKGNSSYIYCVFTGVVVW